MVQSRAKRPAARLRAARLRAARLRAARLRAARLRAARHRAVARWAYPGERSDSWGRALLPLSLQLALHSAHVVLHLATAGCEGARCCAAGVAWWML